MNVCRKCNSFLSLSQCRITRAVWVEGITLLSAKMQRTGNGRVIFSPSYYVDNLYNASIHFLKNRYNFNDSYVSETDASAAVSHQVCLELTTAFVLLSKNLFPNCWTHFSCYSSHVYAIGIRFVLSPTNWNSAMGWNFAKRSTHA